MQRAKRTYWYRTQEQILNDCNTDQSTFWKRIGKVGVRSHTKCIPMEILNDDGSTTTSIDAVLDRWKVDFSKLFNVGFEHADLNHVDNTGIMPIDERISILEVKTAVCRANRGKACGFDNIPVEVLKNDVSIAFLHVLFNMCFSNGTMPSIWGKYVINPIPKASSSDPRDLYLVEAYLLHHLCINCIVQ